MDLLEIENAYIPVLLFSAAALRSQTKRRTLVTNTILLYLILYYMLYHTTDIRWVDILFSNKVQKTLSDTKTSLAQCPLVLLRSQVFSEVLPKHVRPLDQMSVRGSDSCEKGVTNLCHLAREFVVFFHFLTQLPELISLRFRLI